MTSLFRNLGMALIGLIFAVFGILHATTSYPDPKVFTVVSHDLPVLGAVASFALGVTGAIAGLILLMPAVFWMRRRKPQRVVVPGGLTRPATGRRNDDFDPRGTDDDNYDGTGSGYGGAYGGNYSGRHHDNGEYDERRRVGLYR